MAAESTRPNPGITDVIRAMDLTKSDDERSVATLLEDAYSELRALAGSFFQNERGDHTLEPTALVHDVFLKLSRGRAESWANRQHFFIVAGKAMRQVLADHARGRNRKKRGGDRHRVTLSSVPADESAQDDGVYDVSDVHEALVELEALNERHAQVVELRFLAGLSIEQVAEALGVSRRTVELDWRAARAWLRYRLSQQVDQG